MNKIREAEKARDELASALRRSGIQLHAMDTRTFGGTDESGYALVHLGDCSAVVARQLAAVIARGAAR